MSQVILLVDDDEGFRSSVTKALELANYEVIEAENGLDAVNTINSNAVDLVITDILMPHMEGIELAREVKKAKPDLKIVGMSGGGRLGIELVKKSAQMFVDDFILKPFSTEDLYNLVEKYANNSPIENK